MRTEHITSKALAMHPHQGGIRTGGIAQGHGHVGHTLIGVRTQRERSVVSGQRTRWTCDKRGRGRIVTALYVHGSSVGSSSESWLCFGCVPAHTVAAGRYRAV